MKKQENKSIDKKKIVVFKNYRNNSSEVGLKCGLKYLQACINSSIEVNKHINTQKNSKVFGLYQKCS